MEGSKRWFESSTIRNGIGAASAFLATIAATLWGVDFDASLLTEAWDKLVIVISGAYGVFASIKAIIGRFKADKKIAK